MFCFTVSACVLSVAVYYSFIIAAPLLSPIYGEPWDVAISGRSRSPLCFIYAHFCCNLLQKQQQCHGQLVPHVTATISLPLRVVLECKDCSSNNSAQCLSLFQHNILFLSAIVPHCDRLMWPLADTCSYWQFQTQTYCFSCVDDNSISQTGWWWKW